MIKTYCIILSTLLYCCHGICTETHYNIVAEDMFIRKVSSARAERHCLLGQFYEENVMESVQKEEWRQIEGYPDYHVSNMGRVKSSKWNSSRILKPGLSGRYPLVSCYNNNIHRAFRVHRLVLKTFTGEPPAKCAAHHKNGVKTDNRLSNLEWIVNKENVKHAYKTKLAVNPKGDHAHHVKLTSNNVRQIKHLLKQQIPQTAIASQFGVCQRAISHIATGRNWSHICQEN